MKPWSPTFLIECLGATVLAKTVVPKKLSHALHTNISQLSLFLLPQSGRTFVVRVSRNSHYFGLNTGISCFLVKLPEDVYDS